MVPYDAGDHFEQIFLLYVDAGGRSLLIGDCLENCWLATSNSCIQITKATTTVSVNMFSKTWQEVEHRLDTLRSINPFRNNVTHMLHGC